MAGRLSRRRLGDLCLLCSALILECVALFGVRSVLAAHQLEGQYTLVGDTRLELPLPGEELHQKITPEMHQPASQAQPTGQIELTATAPAQDTPEAPEVPSLPADIPSPTAPNPPAPTPTPVPVSAAAPMAVNSTGKVVRLVIPKLGVDRAVVPLGFSKSSEGGVDWNTDKLFANANRKDLIGQTLTSVNPGEGGNIVLMGHNYDNGYYAWEGVFVNIKTLSPGDEIIAYTEGGGEYHYKVQLVKKVPWSKENAAEAAKHFKYLGPTPSEQLTLVTCGGANVYPWQARLYVVAVPAQ
jgi:hypothetical protein